MYRLEISHTAHKQILGLPPQTRERINKCIAGLAENPRPHGVKKLTAREGYRIRVGDYRVLFTIYEETGTVVIYRVKARGDAYRL